MYRASGALLPTTKSPMADARGYLLSPLRGSNRKRFVTLRECPNSSAELRSAVPAEAYLHLAPLHSQPLHNICRPSEFSVIPAETFQTRGSWQTIWPRPEFIALIASEPGVQAVAMFTQSLAVSLRPT